MHACAEYVLSILIFRQVRFSVIPDFRQVRFSVILDFRQVRFSVIPDFRQVKISVTVPSSRKLGKRISRNRPVPSRKLGTSVRLVLLDYPIGTGRIASLLFSIEKGKTL